MTPRLSHRACARWAPALLLAVSGILAWPAAVEARRRPRAAPKAPPAPISEGATHALKPLEAIGMEKSRVKKVTAALAKQLSAVPGVKLAAQKDVLRFLKSRDGAPFAQCEGDLACLQKLGSLLGVGRLVAGDLSGLSKGYVLFLRLVDPSKQEVLRTVSVVHGGEGGKEETALREAAYRLLAPEKFVGQVTFEIDVPGAQIYWNGQPLGAAPVAPRQMLAGTHALRVTHPSYHDYLRFIDVAFEQTTRVKVSLKMYPIISEEMKAKGSARPVEAPIAPGQRVIYRPLPFYKKWWFVTAVSAAVLVATLTTVALVRPRHLDRDGSVTLERPLASPAPVLFRFGP